MAERRGRHNHLPRHHQRLGPCGACRGDREPVVGAAVTIPALLAHPDIDLILAMGWREYLRSKYYYAGDHIGWLEYPQKVAPAARESTEKDYSQ